MKLSSVIKVWDILHVKDTGNLTYSDLELAIDVIDGLENDVFINVTNDVTDKIICPFCLSDITDSSHISKDNEFKTQCPECGGEISIKTIHKEFYDVTPIYEDK